ncbi:MAG: hypothetical protein CSA70_05940 [Rhodobacterales bacterium]|nr:MAG: hypothetical protein CSA70_05940 [Rhodobacterales bacterium]
MKKINASSIGIAQGNEVLFEDYQDGGDMWTGSGHRECRHAVRFDEPFKSVPSVQCTISLWDVDSSTNVRAEVEAEYITQNGFDIVFRTWGDTKVARMRIGWIAIGAARHEDDWDLY